MNSKKNVSICIDDNNLFFSQGLFTLMEDFFLPQGVNLFQCEINLGNPLPDIIFSSSRSYTQSCRLWTRLEQGLNPILFIIENRAFRPDYISGETCVSGYVFRNESTSTIIERFKDIWYNREMIKPCQICSQSKLTLRETETLIMLRKNMTPMEIANAMQVNVKTVYCFKSNSMRKLGLKNDPQLYKWLNSKISHNILMMDLIR